MCKEDQTSITRVTCNDEFDDLLKQPFKKPILWRGYTREHPLSGLPSSIPELLQKLRLLSINSLDVYNYAATKPNYRETLDNIIDHFQASPGTRDPLNFLDIRNLFISRVPVNINEVDLLRLARRRQGTRPAPESRPHTDSADRSASKSKKLRTSVDSADHEFVLVSSQGSVSTLHGDTAGGATFIIIISGRKFWYLPRVMPPGCPHAVFTPEHTLAFGGSFYTLPHLGSSLRVLALQDRAGTIFSNEDITEQDFLNFIEMLETCKDLLREDLLQPEQLASVVSSGMYWGSTNDKLKRKIRAKIFEIQDEIEQKLD
ncbi:hypothetical protein BDV12DRAFT_187078 [Aspergillus spectabilis]